MKTVLGGAPPSARNFIWGDGWEGVWIYGDGADRSTVSGNCIGTDSSRVFVVGNTYSGIWISGGAQDNDIGSGNIIAYNSTHGLDGGDHHRLQHCHTRHHPQ